jgi:hypothetical protein
MQHGRLRSIALPAKKREDQTQHDADNDAGDDWEIKNRVSTFDPNVAGKFAQKSRADAAPENESENNNCDTDDYEKFSDLGHDSILVSDPVVSSGVVLDWERQCASGSDLLSRRCIGATWKSLC